MKPERAGGCPRDETPFYGETPGHPPRPRPALGSFPSFAQTPRLPQVCLLRSAQRCARRLRLVATRSVQIPFPSPGPQAQTPPSLPPSQPAGPFPGWGTATPAVAAGSEALVDAVPRRASPPSGGRPRSSPLWGAPSAPAQCPAGGGAQIPVSGGGGGGDRQFSLRRSTKRTGWLSPFAFPALNPPPGSPGFSPCGVSLPPRRRFLGPRTGGSHCPRGGSGSRPRLASPGSVPAVPERRCRRHRRSPPPAALGPGWVELRCPRTSSHCSART